MAKTIRIEVRSPSGLMHLASGFRAWEAGEYDFPGDPRYRGWLQGHVARGAVVLLPPGETPEAAGENTPAAPPPPPPRKRGE